MKFNKETGFIIKQDLKKIVEKLSNFLTPDTVFSNHTECDCIDLSLSPLFHEVKNGGGYDDMLAKEFICCYRPIVSAAEQTFKSLDGEGQHADFLEYIVKIERPIPLRKRVTTL